MSTALATYDGKQLDLIRRTVAKDCNAAEFDQFIHICRAVRLDPLRRQIYAFVFNANRADKRQMTIVTAIGGYRAIADRTGNYRPGPCDVVIDETFVDPATNPKGISHATATVYKFAHGDWHPVTDTAYWDEFAPLKEIWQDDKPTGKYVLDPKKDGWKRMPRVMLEKCAEAKALRRAWPDDFAGLALQEEVDRAHTLDLTATELAEHAAQENRFQAIGGRNALTVDWCDGQALQRVPAGQFGDQALAYIRDNADEPLAVLTWSDRNRETLKEYWALDKSGALAVKAAIEAVEQKSAA